MYTSPPRSQQRPGRHRRSLWEAGAPRGWAGGAAMEGSTARRASASSSSPEARPDVVAFLVAVDPNLRPADQLVLAVATFAAGLTWHGKPIPNARQEPISVAQLRQQGGRLLPGQRGLRASLRRLEGQGVIRVDRGVASRVTVVPAMLHERQSRGLEVVRIPAWLGTVGDLAPRDAIVAGLLHGFRGSVLKFPTAVELARWSGLTIRTVERSFRRLEGLGLLKTLDAVQVGIVRGSLPRERVPRRLVAPDQCYLAGADQCYLAGVSGAIWPGLLPQPVAEEPVSSSVPRTVRTGSVIPSREDETRAQEPEKGGKVFSLRPRRETWPAIDLRGEAGRHHGHR